ncbi:PREDICTED: uncharacterized protein LOC104720310 [Camelina sativa]|uniref:Uncharacterized protein LOC104720310 n=1 Tax=Camelina sativa TaxID=90675 RepID=A0ABM0U6A6_CAMSA|nr:PREDICTED: uncharacterized protein LOC104720310 [Camelina sativa]
MSFAISRAYFSDEEYEAGCCQLFVENLAHEALGWFSRLLPNSIWSYHELTTAFLQHHSTFMIRGASNADLWNMFQRNDESLRDFMERFKRIVSKLSIVDDTSISALRNALAHGSQFREDIIIHEPLTLDDALHRANRYIELDEEKASRTNRPEPPAPKSSKGKEKAQDEHHEPRQHFDKEYADKLDKGKKVQTFAVSNQDPKASSSRPWNNKWVRDPSGKGGNKYCEYHKRAGHSTEECRTLQQILLDKFKEGQIDVDLERRQIAVHRDNHFFNPENENPSKQYDTAPAPQPRPETLPPPPPTHKRNHERTEDANAPAPRRRINMIMGGLATCRDSVRSIKAYRRGLEAKRGWLAQSTPPTTNSDPIVFTEADASGLTGPHNDPLVVEMAIGESMVTKILINTGSSVNVIFKDVLIQMEIDLRATKHDVQPLTGFDSDRVMTEGTIMLPVYVGGTMHCINFAIVDKPIVYNVILDTP